VHHQHVHVREDRDSLKDCRIQAAVGRWENMRRARLSPPSGVLASSAACIRAATQVMTRLVDARPSRPLRLDRMLSPNLFRLRGDTSSSTTMTDRMALLETTRWSGFRSLKCKSAEQEGER
jgi:hypothetical protein